MNRQTFMKLDALAKRAGCEKAMEKYNDVFSSIDRSVIKQFAVLGDVNCGKSTIVNLLAGEKALPVSMRANEHAKVAFAENKEHNVRFVELAMSSYLDGNVSPADSPLWFIDAAIYVIAATTPFSKEDVAAISECIRFGVPCSLVLNKLDATDESERDDIIRYVRQQAEKHFGSDQVIIIDNKAPENAKKAIMDEFAAAEDSNDVRKYLLAVSYAKEIKSQIDSQYDQAKAEMKRLSDQENQTKQAELDEKIAWDRIKLDLEARKMRLTEEMSVEMNRLYADCVNTLANQIPAANTLKNWWEKDLQKAFEKQLSRISNKIDQMICKQFVLDRNWLVKTVEEKFSSALNIDVSGVDTQFENIVFGVAPERVNKGTSGKSIAAAALAASSVALCGALIYPAIAMHAINALYWKISGVAVAGTGFWTFMETQKDQKEKRECLRSELARYVLSSRDDNIEVLKKNIAYGYDSMRISIQDLQLASAKVSEDPKGAEVSARFQVISALRADCEQAVNALVSNQE